MTRALPTALLLGALLAAPPAQAALLTLTDAQQGEALRLGQRSVTVESGFDTEWRVDNPTGESLTVMTPFYRLALAARNAAFKNETVKPQEQSKMVQTLRDRLTFWVQLQGPREDFARYYVPKLVVGDLEVEAAFVQNERTGLRQANGSFLARSVYAFPTRDVTGTSKVVLLVKDPDGRLVTRFAIDLGKMR